MVILQPAAWKLGGACSLDAGGNGSLGVLAAWMLVARMIESGGEDADEW